jgi:hypothetical protein
MARDVFAFCRYSSILAYLASFGVRLGVKIVTGTQAVISRQSPGSVVNALKGKTTVFSKRGCQEVLIDANAY